MEETPITFYSTFIVPKKSPFIKIFNTAIHLIRESGILKKALENAVYEAELLRIERFKKGLIKDKKLQIITLQHFKHMFMFWVACLVVCTIVLFGEIIVFKFNVNPNLHNFYGSRFILQYFSQSLFIERIKKRVSTLRK